MDFANLLIQILNSVQYGLVLFMLAAGLTLIFGIMGVVNLAHGLSLIHILQRRGAANR